MSASESYKDGDGGKCCKYFYDKDLCECKPASESATGNKLSPVDSVKPWLEGCEPIKWFQTIKTGKLCCQNCEQTALRHAAELYEDAHRRIAELEAKLKNQSCGNHPGMSCSEVHLDDKMKIEKLETELDTYVAPSKQRIAELEEIHKQDLAKHERLERRNAELEKQLNYDAVNERLRDLVIARERKIDDLERQNAELEQQVRELREKLNKKDGGYDGQTSLYGVR